MKRTWIVKVAFRNLLRYGRRTIITASAIAFGLLFYIYVDSILTGADQSSKRNLRRYETADGAITGEGYLEDVRNGYLGESFDWRSLAADLESAEIPSAPRLPFQADLIFFKDPFPEDGNIPARVIALDPDLDSRVFRLEENLAEGEWLESGREGIVLGRWVANDIGAEIGSWLIVAANTLDGFPTTMDLEVVGILDSPNPEVNRGGAYMPLDIADYYLELNDSAPVLHFLLPGLMPEGGLPERFTSRVDIGNLSWLSWEELAADYVAVMEAEWSGSSTFIGLILIIAAVGISNTMMMAVLERSREVGMMRALGMGSRHIRRLFLWEAAGIGFTGGLMGVGLGLITNIPLVNRGLDFTFFFAEETYGYRISGIFYGAWHWQGIVFAFALGVGLSVLVALVSIRRILKLGIVESLRYN